MAELVIGNLSALPTSYNVSGLNTSEDELREESMGQRAERILLQPHKIIALFLCLAAIVSNIMSLLALMQVRRHVMSHFRLIMSLAASDTLIGFSVMLHIINEVVNPVRDIGVGTDSQRKVTWCLFMIIKALNTLALNITLLNLIGMALDHYLAILRPLHHPMLMNTQRTNAMIIVLWALAILTGFSDFFSGIPLFPRYKHRYNYCEFIWRTKYQEEYTVFATALICFVLMMFIYIRIYVEVRRCQRRSPAGQELTQNKKALVTTLLILGTFVLCWLPKCIFEIAMIIQVKIDKSAVANLYQAFLQANQYLYDLLLLNSICDPVIYAIRMREVRYGYKRLFEATCGKMCHYHRPQSDYNSTHFTLVDDSNKKTYVLATDNDNEAESCL